MALMTNHDYSEHHSYDHDLDDLPRPTPAQRAAAMRHDWERGGVYARSQEAEVMAEIARLEGLR